MARQNKRDCMETLAKKAARLMHKTSQFNDRITVAEREMVSSVASGVDPADMKYRLKELRRKNRGPAKQARSVMARLEAMGGAHLLETHAVKPRTRKAKKA